jgi:hypothetical protein
MIYFLKVFLINLLLIQLSNNHLLLVWLVFF